MSGNTSQAAPPATTPNATKETLLDIYTRTQNSNRRVIAFLTRKRKKEEVNIRRDTTRMTMSTRSTRPRPRRICPAATTPPLTGKPTSISLHPDTATSDTRRSIRDTETWTSGSQRTRNQKRNMINTKLNMKDTKRNRDDIAKGVLF